MLYVIVLVKKIIEITNLNFIILWSDNCEWIRRPTYCADQIFFPYNKILNPIRYRRFSELINFKSSRYLYTVFLSLFYIPAFYLVSSVFLSVLHIHHRNKNNVLSQPDTITCDNFQHRSVRACSTPKVQNIIRIKEQAPMWSYRPGYISSTNVFRVYTIMMMFIKTMLQSNDIKVPLLASL